jgi:hypothetical protein
MKQLTGILVLVSTLLITGCGKEIPTSNVTYSITENSPASPAYDIVYTSDKSGGQTVTQYNAPTYSSGKIELEQGQHVSLTVSCIEPVYSLSCNIFVNGNLWKSASFSSGGSVTLAGEIPAE